jgi:hypothetical protein
VLFLAKFKKTIVIEDYLRDRLGQRGGLSEVNEEILDIAPKPPLKVDD